MEQSVDTRGIDTDLSLLLDNVPGVVARIDTEGIFQYVSAGSVRIYGRTPEGGRLSGLELLSREDGVLGGVANRLRHRGQVAGPLGELESTP